MSKNNRLCILCDLFFNSNKDISDKYVQTENITEVDSCIQTEDIIDTDDNYNKKRWWFF